MIEVVGDLHTMLDAILSSSDEAAISAVVFLIKLSFLHLQPVKRQIDDNQKIHI